MQCASVRRLPACYSEHWEQQALCQQVLGVAQRGVTGAACSCQALHQLLHQLGKQGLRQAWNMAHAPLLAAP